MAAASPIILAPHAGAAGFSHCFSVPAFFAPLAATTTDSKCELSCRNTANSVGRRRRTCYDRDRVGCGCLRSDGEMAVAGGETGVEEERERDSREVRLNSVSPMPLLFLAALPGAETIKSLFAPFVEIVKVLNLPDWLVHWGHPGNMAVVLFAMGGYGTYLGFRIRFSDDVDEKAKAKDLHPKLLAGMFFFFAVGATGGMTSLLTSDKPILESPHAVTGIIGLTLLTIQSILPTLFEGNPGLRNVHGILGSGIMALFLIHAAFGLQLGLSY